MYPEDTMLGRKGIEGICKEAEAHIAFVGNSNIHAYMSMLIKNLLRVIEEQGALIEICENGQP